MADPAEPRRHDRAVSGHVREEHLTFNPGWDRACATLPAFDDVREIQRRVEAQGIAPIVKADASSTGPAHIVLTDPDGNPVLIDQHVAKGGA